MDKPVKMIAIDIDGTLLNDEYQCDEQTKELLVELEKQGIPVLLCTGRALKPAKKIAEQIGIASYLISDNGAVVYHIPSQSPLLVREMKLSYFREVAHVLEGTGAHLDATSLTNMYTIPHNRSIASMYDKYMVSPIVVDRISWIEDPILKATLSAQPSEIDRIMKVLPVQLSAYPVQCFRSGPHFIDIMHMESSKGSSLQFLSHHLGIPSEHIMAIGNYYNDLDMIRYAGIGVAMGNAPADVKQAANYVTSTNNEQGVRKAIEFYLA